MSIEAEKEKPSIDENQEKEAGAFRGYVVSTFTTSHCTWRV